MGAAVKLHRRRPERHTALTDDGWTLALYRYRPVGPPRPAQSPVFLCHGLGANRFNLDAPGKLSLAKWLSEKGFDCWVVELRGAGKSSRPTRTNALEYDWVFDDYVDHDIPAALEVVRNLTGAPRVHWVGHSMGGMIAYAYVIRRGGEALRSLTAIASPSFSKLGHRLLDRAATLRWVTKVLPKAQYEGVAKLSVLVMPAFRVSFGRLLANPRNVDSRALMRLVWKAPADLPMSLLAQLADWYVEGGFWDGSGRMDYTQFLSKIEVPSLIIAGAYDKLTPPADIKLVYDRLGSSDKKYLLCGKAMGCVHDYGHIDLVLGNRAEREIWTHISSWIDTHGG